MSPWKRHWQRNPWADPYRIATFFRTFTTFRLFREPYFLAKLKGTSSVVQVKALLMAIFAFACNGATVTPHMPHGAQLCASNCADMANKYVDEALVECGDDAPPLCVLQALILATHWMIVRGVRGRSWRRVGTCIRLSFEIGLHAIDTDTSLDASMADPDKWCRDEEGRRAYWAVWEMDQFTSHIKRLPIITEWTRDSVHLPAEDEKWLAGQPQRSCPLASDWMDRCKNLQATGSKSARAWYIVIASLNAIAHDIAYSQKVDPRHAKVDVRVVTDHWPALFNALQLSLILLPQELQFHGQYLDFGTHTMGLAPSTTITHLHSAIYEIALMPETSKVISLRPYVFEAYMRKLLREAQGAESRWRDSIGLSENMARKVEQCFTSADNILNLVVNSHQSHHRYVNPYITQVSWLAATVQLLRQELVEDETEKRLISSSFEIFKATNEKFMQYWNMSTTPLQNLETLELRLKQFSAASQRLMSGEKMTAARIRVATPAPRAAIPARYNSEPSVPTLSRNTSQTVEIAPRSRANENSAATRENRRHQSQAAQVHQCNNPRPNSNVTASESFVPPMRSLMPTEMFSDSGLPYQNLDENIWSQSLYQLPQATNVDSELLDWLSIFDSTEINEGFNDYYQLFSAPNPD